MKKALYILGLTLVLIVIVLFSSPLKFQNGVSRQVSGTCSNVYQSGKEAILKINGLKTTFCIKKSYHSQELKNQLLGKKVTILYNDSWTPLDPGSKKQIAELSIEEKLFYSSSAEH